MPEETGQIPAAPDQVTLTKIPVQYNSGVQTKQSSSLTLQMNQKVQLLRNKGGAKKTTLEEDEKHFPPGHLSAAQMKSAFGEADRLEAERKNNEAILSKYTNLSSMQGADKIKALKDKSLDPFKIAGPDGEHAYDGLMNSLQRWKDMASGSEVSKMDQVHKDKAAENYYKGMLLPFYQMMKKEPPPPELWKSMAYTKALQWNMDGAYKSHWRQGLYEGGKDYENLGKFLLTSVGGLSEHVFDLGKGILTDVAHGQLMNPGGHRDFTQVLSEIGQQVHSQGVYKEFQNKMNENPLWSSLYKSLDKASKTDEFWSDINPNENWRQSATSSAVELVTQLPLFKGLSAANESLFATKVGTNLTKALGTSKLGQLAAKMLTFGGEGGAYGYVIRDDSDKNKAWQDAIAAGVLGTVFHVAGEKLRLGDALKGKAKTAYTDTVENLSLVKKGIKIGDADTLEPEVIKQASHTLAAGGLPTHLAAIRSALEFIKATEGMDRTEIRRLIKQHLTDDPVKWTRVHQYGQYLRALMRGKQFSELNEEDIQFLYSRIDHITQQGGERINQHVPEAQAEAGKQSVKNMQGNKNGQDLIKETAGRLKQEAQEAGLPPRPDADYMKAAEEYHARLNAEAAARAAEKRANQPVAEVKDVETRKVRAEKTKPFEPPIEDPGYMRQRTKYWTNKKGEPAVSFSINKEWKSYLQNRIKDAGLKWDSKSIKAWVDGLSPEDFVADLKDFAYPKELREAEIHFESESNREGTQNPNFLAFMYNYVDHMPKEYADRLSQELEDSVKFEKSFNPRVDTETQKRYYAEAMYNHMNDFLQSGRFPEEANIFRSTLSDLRNPTVWQEELHNEAVANEIDIIHDMYKRHPEAREAALAAHERLSKARARAFKAGKQTERRGLTEQIYENIFSSRERWNF